MTDLDINSIEPACQTITRTFSDETLSQFVSKLDEIPTILANSSESFKAKLLTIQKASIFTAINGIFRNPIDSRTQLRILKFWDFLISTCGTPEELNVLFTEDATNNLILYPFEFSSTEVLQSYATVLKGISMKAKHIDPRKLFTSDESECPLFSHSIPFIVNKDSVVVSAARLVVLNLCLIKYPPLQSYLSDKVSRAPLEFLIENIGSDELDFLADFLNVAPLNLGDFVIERLRYKLSKCPQALLCRAATFLAESPAHSMLVEVLSTRIHSFPVTSPLTLGLLLYCLEKRLILLDAAIKWGLISSPEIPRFSKETRQPEAVGDFCDELKEMVIQRISLECFAVSLRCLELLYKEIPRTILEVNAQIIEEMKGLNSNKLMEILIGPHIQKQRCDIEYLLDNTDEAVVSTDPERNLVVQLQEIQSAICRWRGKRFIWFSLDELFNINNNNNSINTNTNNNVNNNINDDKSNDNDENAENVENDANNSNSNNKDDKEETQQKEFTLTDGNTVRLSRAEIEVPETGLVLSTAALFLKKKDAKTRRYIDIVAIDDKVKNQSSASLLSIRTEQHHFEFPSSSVSGTFEAEIVSLQKEIIGNMLNKLEQ